MKTPVVVIFCIFLLGCSKNERSNLNKIFPLQEPKIRTVLDLDTVCDSISVDLVTIWDNKPVPDSGSINKPDENNKIIKNIMVIQPGPDSSILILDDLRSRIIKMSYDGKWLGVIGEIGSGPGEMLKARWFYYFKDKIYIADQSNGRMQILTGEGKYIRQIDNFRLADMKSRFAIGKNGEIISRTKHGDLNLIVIYDSLGNVLKKFGNYVEYGAHPYQQSIFNNFFIICDTLRNNVWCFFENLPLIRRYDFEGNFLEEITIVGKERLRYPNKWFEENSKINNESVVKNDYGVSSFPYYFSSHFIDNKVCFSSIAIGSGYYVLDVNNGITNIKMVYYPRWNFKTMNEHPSESHIMIGTHFFTASSFCSILKNKL